MRLVMAFLVPVGLVVSTGCTAFNGSAAASAPTSAYVAGQKAAFPAAKAAVWLCPTSGGGDCKPVELDTP